MLLDWDWFRQEMGQVWEHPKESLAPQGRIEETALHRGAWQEGERQRHKLKRERLRLEPQGQPRGGARAVSILGGFMP